MTRSSDRFDPTPSSLIDQVRFRSADAWRRLVRLYAPLVYTWCVQSGLSPDDAADAVQEVFTSVSAAIADFHLDKPEDTFRGWLRVITRNKIRDYYRRRTGEPAAVGGSSHQQHLAAIPCPDDESTDSDSIVLRRGLDLIRLEFEERTWQAFWRTAVENQRTADVAVDLAMTSTAVRKARSRVLHRLREALADPLDGM